MNDNRHEESKKTPTWSEEAKVRDILKKKTGVMVCIPNLNTNINTQLAMTSRLLSGRATSVFASS